MRWFISTVLLIVVGCGGDSSEVEHFPEIRVYAQGVFDSLQACIEYNEQSSEDMHVNCERIVEFAPDGRMAMMVTDIVGSGTYRIADDTIECNTEHSMDFFSTFSFSIQNDGAEIDLIVPGYDFGPNVWFYEGSSDVFLLLGLGYDLF